MQSINYIIIENSRLSFDNSVLQVKEFITKRLTFFRAKTIKFVERECLPAEIQALSNNKDYIAIIDIMNPIIDIDLIRYAADVMKRSDKRVIRVEGAIPGTQFEYLLAPGVDYVRDDEYLLYFSQENNNQFDLYKYKRLKMFLILYKLIESMPELSVNEIVNRLSEKKIFERLAAFGENISVKYYKFCPHCGADLQSLPMKMSQPFCGYIPSSQSLYHKCIKCGLIVLSPYIEHEKSQLIYDKWDKQDFILSHNNPYNSNSPRCDFRFIMDKLPDKVRCIDLGGGIGNYSKYLKSAFPNWEVTHSDFAIKQNRELESLGIQTKSLNILEDKIGVNEYDLISAWEVIEHIPYEKLGFVIDNIYSALKPGGIFIFSTPNFDSPLCKMNDFYAICPPFHYLCFGQRWLLDYFNNQMGWETIKCMACSDFLDDSDMWCDYASRTAPSFQQRATADVLKILLSKDENKKLLLDHNIGTEIIIALQKKDS